MSKRIKYPLLVAMAFTVAGCESKPAAIQTQALSTPARPDVAKAVILPTTAPTTSPSEVIAELSTMQIGRAELDDLLYKTYGLQMLFDIVELRLAKNTLAEKHLTLTQADIDRERDLLFAKLFPGDKADYEANYVQFLSKEKVKREEFEVRVIQTSAALRKIIEPMVVGTFHEPALRRGFEIMYGAKRQIADITLGNSRDAGIARERVKTEPFEKVVKEMSIDKDTKDTGGVWLPFTAQNQQVPNIILKTAFSIEVGQVSDMLEDNGSFHIIKLLGVTEPKLAKFEDVKETVRNELESHLIESNMKTLRQQLESIAQQQIKFDDPVLKAQWDRIVQSQQPATTDRDSALNRLNAAHQGPPSPK